MHASEALWIGLPTRDGQAQIQSVLEILALGRRLGRPTHFLIGEAGNIPRSRNLVLHQARQKSGEKDRLWILWLDSDIIIPSGGHLAIADAILWSEATDNAWVAHYRMADGKSVITRQKDGTHYTMDEIMGLPPWVAVGMAGLGLAYLPMNLNYVFHADVWGEDTHFFRDHPDLRIYFARDIRLYHRKTVTL